MSEKLTPKEKWDQKVSAKKQRDQELITQFAKAGTRVNEFGALLNANLGGVKFADGSSLYINVKPIDSLVEIGQYRERSHSHIVVGSYHFKLDGTVFVERNGKKTIVYSDVNLLDHAIDTFAKA